MNEPLHEIGGVKSAATKSLDGGVMIAFVVIFFAYVVLDVGYLSAGVVRRTLARKPRATTDLAPVEPSPGVRRSLPTLCPDC